MASIAWNSPVSGDWNVATNWSPATTPGAADDVTISAGGIYIVTIGSADFANSLNFDAPNAQLVENTGTLVTNTLAVSSGSVSLNKPNTIGSITLAGGTLAFGNAGALGSAAVALSGGELLGIATETLTNTINLAASTDLGTETVAAAHGTTLTLAGVVSIAGGIIHVGASGQDGDVVWSGTSTGVLGSEIVDVSAGTLTAGNSDLGTVLQGTLSTKVDAGATLDWAGNTAGMRNLRGAGTVTNTGATQTMLLSGGADFSGSITGALSVTIGGPAILSGDSTYSGTTTIQAGTSLQLGVGGSTGSIGGGDIDDEGTLTIDRNNALTLTNAISGAGVLRQIGNGVTSINTANTYSGGTTLAVGALAVGNGGALGTGTLIFQHGELLGTATETFANAISLAISGSTTTFAAAHRTALTLTGGVGFAGNNTVDIGAPGQDGEIIWSGASSGLLTGGEFDVLAGTLAAGNASLAATLSAITGTTVEAGATIDWAGNAGTIADLQGAGTVTNTGAVQTLTLGGPTTSFSGTISGALAVVFVGSASLSGLEDYTGGASLTGPIAVANTGTYDIVSDNGLAGSSASTFTNNGLFEKTLGSGVSAVTTNFVNNGTLTVLSGSVQFRAGFANNGVIHGIVSQSGGVTTITAAPLPPPPITVAVPNDLNGDGMSDVLWRNGNGALADWLMNGGAISGGTPSANGTVISPDASWSVAGIGDFNGDGKADVLWRDTSGELITWLMNGNSITSSADVTLNGVGVRPDASWSVVGTGDFDGDNRADILWRNTSGELTMWLMNGNTIASSGDVASGGVAVRPDASWSVAGIGDFNGTGKRDILWRNSSGELAEWQMNGAAISGSGDLMSSGVAVRPDAGWSVAGIGDFNGDGKSDILWRNTSGALAEWSMNGTSIIGSGAITANGDAVAPDASWHIVEVGDFNDDGRSDILWRNDNGALEEWQMNGTAITQSLTPTASGVPASPGTTWSPQAKPTNFG